MATADAVLGGARLQMASYEMIGNAVQNGFAQLSQAQKARGDAYEGMFRSALGFRQQQQDAYFRQKGLELQEKQQIIDSEYKDSLLGFKQQEIDLKMDEVEIKRLEDIEKIKNRTSVSALSGIRISTGAELNALSKQIDFNNQIIETGTKQLELYKTSSPADYFGPKGQELKNRIEKAQADNSGLGTKRIDIGGRFEEITGAMQAIGSGADAEMVVSSLQLNKTNKNVNTFDDSLINSKGFGSGPTSGPGARFGYQGSGNPLFGDANIIPNDPITPDQPKVSLKTNDVLQVLLNDKANDYAKKQAISLADDEAKKYINTSKNAAKYQAANAFASSIGWNLPKELIARNPSAVKQIEAATKEYKDLQGNESEVGQLMMDAQRSLSDIRNDPSVKDSEGNIIVSKVQDKFNQWLINKIDPKPAEDTKTALSPTGELKASNGATLNFGSSKLYVDGEGFVDNTQTIIPDKYETRKEEKRQLDINQEFTSRFIKNGEFDKSSFENWAAVLDDKSNVFGLDKMIQNSKVTDTLFGGGFYNPEDLNQERKNKIGEISSSKDKALEFFKKYGR